MDGSENIAGRRYSDPGPSTSSEPVTELVEVRATIHLPGGLRPGDIVTVDPTLPYEAECIKAGYLHPVPKADAPPVEEAEPATLTSVYPAGTAPVEKTDTTRQQPTAEA